MLIMLYKGKFTWIVKRNMQACSQFSIQNQDQARISGPFSLARLKFNHSFEFDKFS
ncbi:hypothetical protein TorRG33x02_173560 [Trema orientale]|uniref:Uncharacterized protein n=1 Tax=Trema orientale TaxID=63057 RepID=A0A2P5EMQ2_TREOI|nr:hypothetical protein TorRG33x02_173560 [Trema orientale]